MGQVGWAGSMSEASSGETQPASDRAGAASASAFPGPFTRLGLTVAVVVGLLDQASKLWLLYVFDLGRRGAVAVAPVIDLVLVRNYGISYGLFQQDGMVGRWVLIAITAVAVVCLGVWLARSQSRLAAIGLGLIIGGAIGNAIDRLAHAGAVIDFVRFHITTASFNFNWYVFNLADAAIVAGVAALLYESFHGPRAAKVP